MRKFNGLLILALVLLCIVRTAAPAQEAEEAAVGEAIQHYFRAHATGDAAHLRKAFHPDAKIFFVRDGKVVQWTLEEYMTRFNGKPAEDEARRKRTIDRVDITGSAAVARVTLDYPNVVFVDYMSLLKVDGQWLIVNKTFHAKPRS